MKKHLLFTGFAALLVLSACGSTDNENEAGTEPTEPQEETDENTQDEQGTDAEDQQTDEPTYSLDELEPVFYVGMDYGTYYEELQDYHFAKTIQNEEEGQYLDLFIANDGYLGILNSEEEGIINTHRYQSLDEADGYFD